MEVEDDRLVRGEERVEVAIGEAVRMLGVGLQPEQIDDVDEADLQVGEFLAQDGDRGEGFHGRDVAGAGHDDIGLDAVVGARPVPDADALGAVVDRGVHVEVDEMRLLVGDDDVDVIA